MKKTNTYSKEFSEFIAKPPAWTLKSGSTIIVIGFLILVILSAFIDYNDIIVSSVIVSPKNPPVKIRTLYNGELEKVYINHGQKVLPNQTLAEIKNPAKIEDVLFIKEKINDISNLTELSLDSLNILYPNSLELGSVQASYNDFFLTYQEYILNDSLQPLVNEGELLFKQIGQEKNLLNARDKELSNFKQELNLSKRAYARSKTLYDKGVISRAEFDKASRERLTDKQKYESLKSRISETEINIIKLKQDSTLKNAFQIRTFGANIERLKQSVQILKTEIQLWEEKYHLVSPISGTVNLFDNYHKYQNIESGETLFTIFPDITNGIIGSLQIPVLNSGKVKKGQQVIIKLENYPHYQYGFLNARVTGISGAPDLKTNTYRVFIELESEITSHGHELDFNKELLGTAEIITEKLSLLQRLFYGLRRVFSRNNI